MLSLAAGDSSESSWRSRGNAFSSFFTGIMYSASPSSATCTPVGRVNRPPADMGTRVESPGSSGETDRSTTMEGLYIKVEEDGQVTQRVKFVRGTFLQVVEESQTHWLERPIVPNGLSRPLEELFLPELER